jgi:hypothetical protein
MVGRWSAREVYIEEESFVVKGAPRNDGGATLPRSPRHSRHDVILSEAKNLIQYRAAQGAATSTASSCGSRRGSMDEILRRQRRSSG